MILMNSFTSLGKISAFVLAYMCLESTSGGNWRLMMVINGGISIFGPLFVYLYFVESPRFLLATGDFKKGIENMNTMGTINNGHTY